MWFHGCQPARIRVGVWPAVCAVVVQKVKLTGLCVHQGLEEMTDASRSGKSLCLGKITRLSRLRVNHQGPSHTVQPIHGLQHLSHVPWSPPSPSGPAVLSGVGGRGTIAYLPRVAVT